MGWFSKLFGQQSKIRFKGKTADGRTFTGTTEVEFLGLSEEELTEKVKNACIVEYGYDIVEFEIVAMT